ncbi:hypothetical protein Pst134EA_031584 [Puccinia striiformis f. sp. tritici]|uniref:uncharacterized protein n=1 Tax=Puccinia striiformis f. sp. tritici TaxID=168172 RepID=UPI00200890D7|nr:uncharacterized protein Pst134EA_031584 [Puccinia striiformis f. sp. tritici]KAH9442736.1 hypothetical protein Pst134EA_031584 [Puccinia striiformis f. sp. tritici]
MTQSRQTTPAQDTTTNRHSTRVRTPFPDQVSSKLIPIHGEPLQLLLPLRSTPIPLTVLVVANRKQLRQKGEAKPKGQSRQRVIDVESGINIVQDSDDENAKAEDTSKVDLDEFDNPKLHYHTPYQADDQVSQGRSSYLQMSLVPEVSPSEWIHRFEPQNTPRWCNQPQPITQILLWTRKAIIEGANLPISSDEKAAAAEKAVPTGTLTSYVTKGKFDINTMNKVLLFWIIRQSLPWARFGDYLLGVAFDYTNANAKVFSNLGCLQCS